MMVMFRRITMTTTMTVKETVREVKENNSH